MASPISLKIQMYKKNKLAKKRIVFGLFFLSTSTLISTLKSMLYEHLIGVATIYFTIFIRARQRVENSLSTEKIFYFEIFVPDQAESSWKA